MRHKRKNADKKTKLFNKAWKVFSAFIRKRDKGVCYTCGDKKEWKKQHAGHFIHGKSTPIYFNEKNVHCQCIGCNHFKSGNRDIYLRNLQKQYSIKLADDLMKQRDKIHYYTISELEEIIKKYS